MTTMRDPPFWDHDIVIATRVGRVDVRDAPDWLRYDSAKPIAVQTVRVDFRKIGREPWYVSQVIVFGQNRLKAGLLGSKNSINLWWPSSRAPAWLVEVVEAMVKVCNDMGDPVP